MSGWDVKQTVSGSEPFKVYENELKPCPFCGKTESLIVGTDEEFGEVGCGEYYQVCCSAYQDFSTNRNDGGCGASSGYAFTREEAIEKWNRRAE